MRYSLLLLLSSALLNGCGYHWHSEFPLGRRPLIVVPFIPGDEEGALTAMIIARLETSGLAKVSASHGDFDLAVKLLGDKGTQIGYRRDPQKIKNNIQKNLVCAELRKTVDIEVALLQRGTKHIAYGPYKISASTDYDYVDGDSLKDLTFPGPGGVLIPVVPFSLGQLEDLQSAELAATNPLYHKLAQKIVDVISSEW